MNHSYTVLFTLFLICFITLSCDDEFDIDMPGNMEYINKLVLEENMNLDEYSASDGYGLPKIWNDFVVYKTQNNFRFLDSNTNSFVDNDLPQHDDSLRIFSIDDQFLYNIDGNTLKAYSLNVH